MTQAVPVRAYILAGGRSSRMGRDKAMLRLGGRTLLGRAVDTLRAVSSLGAHGASVSVTVVGSRTELEGADRAIADGHSGCGPLGGMEAALRDLTERGDAEWAFFLPVDMPFLPPGLVDALLQEWFDAAQNGARACYVVMDGRPQPLVSLIHKSLHLFMLQALTSGQLKVTPVLQSATEVLASPDAEGIRFRQSVLHTTHVFLDGSVPVLAGWNATEEQEQLQRLWFSNLNNEEDFKEAETFALRLGFS